MGLWVDSMVGTRLGCTRLGYTDTLAGIDTPDKMARTILRTIRQTSVRHHGTTRRHATSHHHGLGQHRLALLVRIPT